MTQGEREGERAWRSLVTLGAARAKALWQKDLKFALHAAKSETINVRAGQQGSSRWWVGVASMSPMEGPLKEGQGFALSSLFDFPMCNAYPQLRKSKTLLHPPPSPPKKPDQSPSSFSFSHSAIPRSLWVPSYLLVPGIFLTG